MLFEGLLVWIVYFSIKINVDRISIARTNWILFITIRVKIFPEKVYLEENIAEPSLFDEISIHLGEIISLKSLFG